MKTKVRIRKVFRIPFDLVMLLITYWPGSLGYTFRYRYWKRKLKYLGKNVRIDVGVYFQRPGYISIDENTWIDRNVVILAGPDQCHRESKYIFNHKFQLIKGEVYIGRHVHIGIGAIISGIGGVLISENSCLSAGVKIYSFSHHYRSLLEPDRSDIHYGSQGDYVKQFMIEGPVVLEENVGVGLNSIILPGVSIGNNSFVAINSVVLQSFPANSFIQGNPGQRVKSRFKDKRDE